MAIALQAPTPSPAACDTIRPPNANGSGMVFHVAGDGTGRVAWTDVADPRKVPNVYVRDQRGVVRVVGRRGAGPGEFRLARHLIWRGDSLWVTDDALARFQ